MKYLVMAYRYGTTSCTYPVGIFNSKDEAIFMARRHREYRGGKYDHKVFEVEKEDFLYDAEECPSSWITGEKAE